MVAKKAVKGCGFFVFPFFICSSWIGSHLWDWNGTMPLQLISKQIKTAEHQTLYESFGENGRPK